MAHHDNIVAFISRHRTCVIVGVCEARIGRETGSATGTPRLINILHCFVGSERFEPRQEVVHDFEHFEVLLLDRIHHLVELAGNVHSQKAVHKRATEQGAKNVLRCLVVNNFALIFRAILC